MANKSAPMELKENDITAIPINKLSSAFSKEGVIPDEGFFGGVCKLFDSISEVIARPKNWWQKAASLYSDMVAGATAGAATGGFIGGFFGGIGAVPGAIIGGAIGGVAGAIGRPLSALLRFGKENAGLVTNGAKVAAALGAMGVVSGLSGQSMPEMIRGLMQWGDVLYDFNWDMSDSQIWSAIKSTIDSLYGQAGSFLGASFARLILLGTVAKPKMTIDIKGLSLIYNELGEDKRQELLDGVKGFARLGITAIKKIGFLLAYATGRQGIRAYFKSSPELKTLNPKLWDTVVSEWGNEEDPKTEANEIKDWKISTWVDNKKENARNVFGEQIGDFIENFVEEFSETIGEGIEDWADQIELEKV